MRPTRGYRFWVWSPGSDGGWVRLTVRADGRPLTYATGGQADEGGWWQATSWSVDQDRLVEHSEQDQRDCDGRFTSDRVRYCDLSRLTAGEKIVGAPDRPDWQLEGRSQRDYAAEAAGY